MLTHTLHPFFTRTHSPIDILIAGAGGNGSKIVVGLKSLDGALHALGHPGLQVALADGDTVSESNLVRGSFYPSDVGLNKAAVLINRINLSCGLEWQAYPRHLDAEAVRRSRADILVTCVDSRHARATVQRGLTADTGLIYHLDLGNTQNTGQFVLGCPLSRYNPRKSDRLRTAFELFPELTDTNLPEDDTPSCSTLEALAKQDLLINDTLVTAALALLWRLLRHGEVDCHGGFADLKSGSVRPLLIDPNLWKRFRRQSRRAKSRASQQTYF